MRKNKCLLGFGRVFFMVLMVILVSTAAKAITVDPDYLPGGAQTTNYQGIANSYSSLGVTMQVQYNGSGSTIYSGNDRVQAVTSTKASTGTKVFGEAYTPYWKGPASGDGGTRIHFNFTNGASYASLDFIPYTPNTTYTTPYGTRPYHEGVLLVYDGATLLQQILVPNKPLNTVRVLGSHITKIVATGMGYPSLYHAPGLVYLDNLNYYISVGGGGGMPLTLINDTIFTGTSGFTLGSQDTLDGTGTIQGNLGNSGTISPGASPGKITIDGTFSQNQTGKLKLEIGGAGTSLFDFLDVNGIANLGGTLEVGLINNFIPADGQSFKILEYNTRSNSFLNYLGLSFTGGHFDLDYGATSLSLISRLDSIAPPDPAAVPEPATMLLFGTGLAGLAAARRRKKAC